MGKGHRITTDTEVTQVEHSWRNITKTLEFETVKKSMSRGLLRIWQTAVYVEDGNGFGSSDFLKKLQELIYVSKNFSKTQ